MKLETSFRSSLGDTVIIFRTRFFMAQLMAPSTKRNYIFKREGNVGEENSVRFFHFFSFK